MLELEFLRSAGQFSQAMPAAYSEPLAELAQLVPELEGLKSAEQSSQATLAAYSEPFAPDPDSDQK